MVVAVVVVVQVLVVGGGGGVVLVVVVVVMVVVMGFTYELVTLSRFRIKVWTYAASESEALAPRN